MKRYGRVLLVLLLALTLGGCASRQSGSAADSAMPQLVIGSDTYEPFYYLTVEDKPTGLDVELAEEACRRMGYEPVFREIVWEQKDELLANGEVDCLWGCFSMNGRESNYNWVGPYLYSRQMVLVRADSDIYTLADLKDRRVAVQATGKAEAALLSRIDVRIPELMEVYSMSTMSEVFACLRKGYVDAIAGHESALSVLAQSAPDTYRMLNESLSVSSLGVAFAKEDSSAVVEALRLTLEDMRQDGTVDQLVAKYGLDTKNVYQEDTP